MFLYIRTNSKAQREKNIHKSVALMIEQGKINFSIRIQIIRDEFMYDTCMYITCMGMY